jgi:uncharacterized protein DUF3352
MPAWWGKVGRTIGTVTATSPPPATRRHARRRRSASVTALVAVAGLLAACGSSSPGGAEADPAAAVPASAPVYLELVVQPEGQVREGALAAGRKVLGSDDPAGKLAEAFDEMLRDEGVSFARDVAPWLGKRVGFAMIGQGGKGERDVVVVAAAADDDAAAAAVPRLAGAGSVERSHDGVDYRLGRNGDTAAAVHEGRVLVGSEAGVRAAIDAVGGDALAETDRLRRARDDVDADEGLGFLYADVRALARGLLGGMGPQAGPAAMLLPGLLDSLPETVGARLDAAADAVRIDAAARGGSEAWSGAGAPRAAAELPGGSWLGLGIADVGRALDDTIERLSSQGIAGVGVQAFLAQLRQQTGLDLRRDVLSWMGDAGLFVTGERAGSVGGGLVVQAKDAARMRATVGKLAPLVRGLGGGDVAPLHARGVDEGFVVRTDGKPAVYVAAAGERFVIAVGRRALGQAIAPADRLGDQAAFRAAAAKLGNGLRPSFYLDIPAVTRLLERLGGDDRKLAVVRPYLEAFGALVGGSRREGDVTRAKIIATLK